MCIVVQSENRDSSNFCRYELAPNMRGCNMSEVVYSLIPGCLITTTCYSLAMCVLQELCTGIAWHLAFPAAGIAWLNFLESPPCLHASSPPDDEQDVGQRIFLSGKCLTSRFHIQHSEHIHIERQVFSAGQIVKSMRLDVELILT